MNAIEAVTFDLWDTLIQEVPGGSARVAELRTGRIADILHSSGSSHPVCSVEEAYLETGRRLGDIWREARDVPVSEQVRLMLGHIEEDLPEKLRRDVFDDILSVYAEGMLLHPPVLLPGAKDTLAHVRRMVPRMGLISNTGKTPGAVLRKVMSRMDILRYFDTTTFSDELLVRKPDPTMFLRTLEDLRVAPENAVHVGDDPVADIEGASGVGMRTVHVAGVEGKAAAKADKNVASIVGVASAIESLRGADSTG